jgi:hypothetical protein
VGTQRLANLRVRAGHTDRDPGPVANMAPCRREHLNCSRLGTLKHGGQVADHTSGFFVGQSQLYCSIQILDNITESAANTKDDYLTYGACADPPLRSCGWAAC